MATSDPKYPLELLSAQEHIPMCKKHSLIIDITCEDCDKFICWQCAKTDHRDHDWKTISTAGSHKRRDLKKTLGKVKEQDLKELDEMIQQAANQMEDNHKCFDSELSKLRRHFDMIVSKLDEIKKNYENTLRKKLESKSTTVSEGRVNLEKKKEQVINVVEFLEKKIEPCLTIV